MAVMILFCLISRFNITLTSNRYYLYWYLCFDVEQFSIKCLKQCRLVWFYVTQPFDWSRKLAPSSQPIKCKAKNNFDFVIRVFPLHKKFVCFQFVFSLANDNVNLIGRCDYFCFGFSTLDWILLLSNKSTKSFFACFKARLVSSCADFCC